MADLVDRQGRLTPAGVRKAGEIGRQLMAERDIKGGPIPPDIVREARSLVQSGHTSRIEKRQRLEGTQQMAARVAGTLEQLDRSGVGPVEFMTSRTAQQQFPDPTTLEAVEAVPGGEERSFEEIQAELEAEQRMLNPKMGSMLQTTQDVELMEAMDPVGQLPSDRSPTFQRRTDKELNLMAQQAGIEMSMATAMLATPNLSDREASEAQMARQQATDKLRRVRDELDRRGGGGPQEGPLQEFRGGGMVGLPSYDEGGVVGSDDLEAFVAELQAAEPVAKYPFDPSTTEAATLATVEALGDPRFTAASLALPMMKPVAGLARAGLGAVTAGAAKKKAAEKAAVEAFERRSAAYWGEAAPVQHELGHTFAALERGGMTPAHVQLLERWQLMSPVQKEAARSRTVAAFEGMSGRAQRPQGAAAAEYAAYMSKSPGRRGVVIRSPAEKEAAEAAGREYAAYAAKMQEELRKGLITLPQYEKRIQLHPGWTPAASAVTGSATGQHEEYGDPLGLGEGGEYQRYVSGESERHPLSTVAWPLQKKTIETLLPEGQRDVDAIIRELTGEERAQATGPGAAFMQYGQAAVAMDAMLNRIKTKRGKGIELSPGEQAALMDPRSVLQTLQMHGNLTSVPAQDTINWILSGKPTYQEGGVTGTETALVGEEGPELVLTPMEARKQAMEMRRAARAERILQRGAKGAERIRSRGRGDEPTLLGTPYREIEPRRYSELDPTLLRGSTLLEQLEPQAPRSRGREWTEAIESASPATGGAMRAGDADAYAKIKAQGGLFTGMVLQSFPPKYVYVMPGEEGYDAALKKARQGMAFDPGPGQNYQEGGVVGKVVGQNGPEITDLEKGSFVLTAEQTAAANDALKRKGLTWKQRKSLAAERG